MAQIDIVIPAFNRLELLKRALDSVRNQTISGWRVIVVDDGSEEPVAEHIESLNDDRFTVVRHDLNRGVSAARNTGIEAANGDWIAFLDSDDYWKPEKLAKQLELIESSNWTDLVAVCCGIEFQVPGRTFTSVPRSRGYIFHDLLEAGNRTLSGTPSYLVKREDRITARFDESLKCYEDLDYLLQLSQQGSIDFVADILMVSDRRHDGPSLTTSLVDDYEVRISSLDYSIKKEIHSNPGDTKAARLGYLYLVQRALEVGDFQRAKSYLSELRRMSRFHPVPISLAIASILGRRSLTAAMRLWRSLRNSGLLPV